MATFSNIVRTQQELICKSERQSVDKSLWHVHSITLIQVQDWLLSLDFGLSPLNEFYRGKLVHSITLIPFVIF